MAQPQLYQSYAIEKVVSFFGALSETQSFCNGQWLIFPKTAICLANVGKGPKTSFFEKGSQFYWVADQPYHVKNSATYFDIVPAQVVVPRERNARSTSLQVRLTRRNSSTWESLSRRTWRSHRAARTMEWRALRSGPHCPVRCGFDLAALRLAIWILRWSIKLSVRCGTRRPLRIVSAFFSNWSSSGTVRSSRKTA